MLSFCEKQENCILLEQTNSRYNKNLKLWFVFLNTVGDLNNIRTFQDAREV